MGLEIRGSNPLLFFLLAIEKAPNGSAEKVQRRTERERKEERERVEKKKKNIDARLLARQQAGRNSGKQARLNHSTPEAGK